LKKFTQASQCEKSIVLNFQDLWVPTRREINKIKNCNLTRCLMGNHDFYVFLLKLHNTEQTDFIEIFMCCI